MKKLFLLLFLLPFFQYLSAQDGVFETYDDFRNNKFIVADDGTFHWYHNLSTGASGVSLSEKGVKRKWKTKDIAFFISKGAVARSFESKLYPFVQVYVVGDYVMYSISYTGPRTDMTLWCISKDLYSKIYRISNMRDLERLVADDPDFKPLAKLVNHERGGPLTTDMLLDHIKSSKEYKPISELFPMILNSKKD
jgi:hypothetical protein